MVVKGNKSTAMIVCLVAYFVAFVKRKVTGNMSGLLRPSSCGQPEKNHDFPPDFPYDPAMAQELVPQYPIL